MTTSLKSLAKSLRKVSDIRDAVRILEALGYTYRGMTAGLAVYVDEEGRVKVLREIIRGSNIHIYIDEEDRDFMISPLGNEGAYVVPKGMAR